MNKQYQPKAGGFRARLEEAQKEQTEKPAPKEILDDNGDAIHVKNNPPRNNTYKGIRI